MRRAGRSPGPCQRACRRRGRCTSQARCPAAPPAAASSSVPSHSFRLRFTLQLVDLHVPRDAVRPPIREHAGVGGRPPYCSGRSREPRRQCPHLYLRTLARRRVGLLADRHLLLPHFQLFLDQIQRAVIVTLPCRPCLLLPHLQLLFDALGVERLLSRIRRARAARRGRAGARACGAGPGGGRRGWARGRRARAGAGRGWPARSGGAPQRGRR